MLIIKNYVFTDNHYNYGILIDTIGNKMNINTLQNEYNMKEVHILQIYMNVNAHMSDH